MNRAINIIELTALTVDLLKENGIVSGVNYPVRFVSPHIIIKLL